MKHLIKKLLREGLDSSGKLYHGTHIKNLEDIKKYGLIPDFGDVVKSTEMYQYYMDDNYINPEDRVEGVLFFSDNPDTWSYSHFGKTKNIDEAILVVVEKNDSIFRKMGDSFYDINGNEVESIDYIDTDKLPFFIEDGDYFSFEEQEPIEILYGDKLKNYISQY
tara:strand:- start:900 stop:1391 length:492 start_codon:yes stop_codon:yes gene_type:complete